jgi:hypothetical protein
MMEAFKEKKKGQANSGFTKQNSRRIVALSLPLTPIGINSKI